MTLPATLRQRYGVSWFRAGQPDFPWPEVRALVVDAAADPSTSFGAEFQGWEYPATEQQLRMMLLVGGSQAVKILPVRLDEPSEAEQVSEDERAAALAELEQSILFLD